MIRAQTTARRGLKSAAVGLLLTALSLMLGGPLAAARPASDFLPRYLEMLGYSKTEIEQLLSGDARLTDLDEAHQLEAMGYSSEEIQQILTGTLSRKELDAHHSRQIIAAAAGALETGQTAEGADPYGRSPGLHSPPSPAADGKVSPPPGLFGGLFGRHSNLARARNRARPYLGAVRTTAQRFRVDPALVLAVIAAESDFQPQAVSPKGAVGLMQLMPHTGELFGATLNDLFNPGANILAGTQFLAECLQRFDDERLALAAYNAGPTRVTLHQAVPPIRETQRYVARVLHLRQNYRTLLAGDPATP